MTVAAAAIASLEASRSSGRGSTSTASGDRVTASKSRSNVAAPGDVQSFSVKTIDGGRFVSPAGKPTVVFFITSQGCDSCAAEAAQLDTDVGGYGDRIAVLGVEMNPYTPVSALRDFRTTVSVHYPLAADPDGRLVDRFGVEDTATTVVLDPHGRVVFRGVAPDTTALRDALAAGGVA